MADSDPAAFAAKAAALRSQRDELVDWRDRLGRDIDGAEAEGRASLGRQRDALERRIDAIDATLPGLDQLAGGGPLFGVP